MSEESYELVQRALEVYRNNLSKVMWSAQMFKHKEAEEQAMRDYHHSLALGKKMASGRSLVKKEDDDKPEWHGRGDGSVPVPRSGPPYRVV